MRKAHTSTDPPETLNEAHRLIVVASHLDPSTERIINYLSDNDGVPINAVFFRYFEEADNEYLARTWLIDPGEAEVQRSRSKRHREPWNGRDFYVNIGEEEHRRWADCRRYGFVSAGQGRWYSRSLKQLFPGARVFACIPQKGYVGVGTVTQEAVPVREFTVAVDGQEIPILDAPLEAPAMDENADDLAKCEYVVGVDWHKTRDRHNAAWETGMFANQNSACKLRKQHTLNRLSEAFDLDE